MHECYIYRLTVLLLMSVKIPMVINERVNQNVVENFEVVEVKLI